MVDKIYQKLKKKKTPVLEMRKKNTKILKEI